MRRDERILVGMRYHRCIEAELHDTVNQTVTDIQNECAGVWSAEPKCFEMHKEKFAKAECRGWRTRGFTAGVIDQDSSVVVQANLSDLDDFAVADCPGVPALSSCPWYV